ncbi:hypothetical protein ABT369_30300 [Dactylosporangium sp. NPDC000244]|uniref:hypothetical protein n=1 Tax=Dactylosporangium sp. NPDC000244 TaxID=3154365 RepID=UPI003320CB96
MLPVGSPFAGAVIGHRRLGVYVRVAGEPASIGLAEFTTLPRGTELPAIGTTVTGDVLWHAGGRMRLRLRGALPPATRTAAIRLRHLDHAFINFADDTRRWVHIHRFRLLGTTSDDRAVLSALIADERFGDHYAGRPGTAPELHGPYRRDHITASSYRWMHRDGAERRVREWAEQFRVPDRLRAEMRRQVYRPLQTADEVFRLPHLGRAALHDWGWVHREFHEFVLLHRASGLVTQIVASDD